MRLPMVIVCILCGLLLLALGPGPAAASSSGPLSASQARAAARAAERAAVRAAVRAREASHLYKATRYFTDKYGRRVGLWVRPARRAGLGWAQIPAVMKAIHNNAPATPRSVINEYGSAATRAALVEEAERYLGVPYVWGGASPSGFDCSGLVMYVFAKFGVHLAHGATMQAFAGDAVSDPIAGDLVFFGGSGYFHHVGICIGGGKMIEAPHTGAVVRIRSISGYAAARRYQFKAQTWGETWPD